MNLPVSVLRRLHLTGMVFWALMAVPAILWWRNSVPFLVFISIYALWVGHFAGWQGARAEHAASTDEGGQ